MQELLTAFRSEGSLCGEAWKSKVPGVAYLDEEGASVKKPTSYSDT